MKKRVGIVIFAGLVLLLSYAFPVSAGDRPDTASDTDRFEIARLAIPGEGWRISFEAPPLPDKGEMRKNGADYMWGTSSGRFTISVFVEVPRGSGMTHKDCYEYYFPRSMRNPAIVKESVVTTQNEKYFRVQRDTVNEKNGLLLRHVNYFFAYRGRWMDVHISVAQPTVTDEDIFHAFDRSLSYGD
jgi:hypothetical protein